MAGPEFRPLSRREIFPVFEPWFQFETILENPTRIHNRPGIVFHFNVLEYGSARESSLPRIGSAFAHLLT
jgi:hypothetical protein